MSATQESFGEFVNRVLREKNLSLSDVERRSERAISDSYLSFIIQDKCGNLTMSKMRALARGLGVPEVAILKAACGIPLIDATESPGREFAHLVYQYDQLSEEHQSELRPIIQLLSREIERRYNTSHDASVITQDQIPS